MVIFRLAEVVMRIIDYKSAYTKNHTSQIANRSWFMSGYYGLGTEEKTELYLAAALHDIGKLATPTEILEKPGKLDDREFQIIKDHVMHTDCMLRGISGFEVICGWAASHHEKLDGTGYHMGKTGDELDFNSRLLACLDIYQAVSEERPYHPRRSHKDTMPILFSMADHGAIDMGIVKDLDVVMEPWSNRNLPHPEEIDAAVPQ
jgi:HD-GYP domain-containing protein (c-di-GMP phosphodiesterase class II)